MPIFSLRKLPLLAFFALSACVSICAEDIASQISGQILGADNRPLAKASVMLIYPERPAPVAQAETDENGRFQIVTDKKDCFGCGSTASTMLVIVRPSCWIARKRLLSGSGLRPYS